MKEKKAVLLQTIDRFKKLTWPDRTLAEEILSTLGIYDIVELGFCMNRTDPRERLAAIGMVEKYLDALMSGDYKKWSEAKETLEEMYYKVAETDEEAIL